MKSITAFFSKLTIGKKVLLAFTPILTVIISMKAAIIGLALLIFIDLLTGIRKNLHLRNVSFNPFKKIFWKSIKSYLLRQTWQKTYEYAFGIVTIVILETLIFGGLPIDLLGKVFSLSELAILLPSAIEVWSIYENMEAVSGTNLLKVLKKFLPVNIAALFNSAKTEELDKIDKDLNRDSEVVEQEVSEDEILEP